MISCVIICDSVAGIDAERKRRVALHYGARAVCASSAWLTSRLLGFIWLPSGEDEAVENLDGEMMESSESQDLWPQKMCNKKLISIRPIPSSSIALKT